MVSVVPDDAEDRPSRGEVSHGDAPDDPLLPREVDVVRRGHEPPVDGSGHQAGHEPLRPVDAGPLGVLLYHHRPGQDRQIQLKICPLILVNLTIFDIDIFASQDERAATYLST